MTTRRALLAAGAAMLAAPVAAGAAAPPALYAFRFEWLEGARGAREGHLDLGTLSADRAALRDKRMLLRRRVAVRIDGPGLAARLSIALTDETPGCIVSVDGIALAAVPRVVEPAHRLGTVVVHQLEIRIPDGVPPGPHLSRLQWLAEPA